MARGSLLHRGAPPGLEHAHTPRFNCKGLSCLFYSAHCEARRNSARRETGTIHYHWKFNVEFVIGTPKVFWQVQAGQFVFSPE